MNGPEKQFSLTHATSSDNVHAKGNSPAVDVQVFNSAQDIAAKSAGKKSPHICLVRPPSVSSKYDLSVSIPPPIGLAYMAAYLKRENYKVTVVDSIGEAPGQTYPGEGSGRHLVYYGLRLDEVIAKVPVDADIIGISVMFSLHWPMAKHLIKQLRSRFPNAFILLGGEHSTALPEFSLSDCPELDACALGEGEATLLNVAEVWNHDKLWQKVPGLVVRNGDKIVRTAPRERIKDVNSLPWPDWGSLPIENYHRHNLSYGVVNGISMPILASRGCPYQCTFCSNLDMWGTRWLVREVEDVIDEIAYYQKKYQATDFSFYDLTAIVQREWILKFCNRLLERGLNNITWQLPSGTRSEALDAEVCAMLFKTGCHYLVYAPESASEKTLERIKKRIHLDKLVESMRDAIANNIVIRFNMIIGFPHETRKDIWRSVKFIFKMAGEGATDVFANVYTPYPGSDLHEELRASGVIGEKLNDNYFYSLTFTNAFAIPWVRCNKNITIAELVAWRTFAYFGFYLWTYISKPTRIWVTIQNIRNHRTQSALENALFKFLQKVGLAKR